MTWPGLLRKYNTRGQSTQSRHLTNYSGHIQRHLYVVRRSRDHVYDARDQLRCTLRRIARVLLRNVG